MEPGPGPGGLRPRLFCTLDPDTHLPSKVSAPYAPHAEAGVVWNDPDVGVAWPSMTAYVLSDRDRALPRLRDLESPFEFEPER